MVKENIYRSKRVNDKENEHENDYSFYAANLSFFIFGRVCISFTTMTSLLLSFFFKNILILFNCYFLRVDFFEGAFIANVSFDRAILMAAPQMLAFQLTFS